MPSSKEGYPHRVCPLPLISDIVVDLFNQVKVAIEQRKLYQVKVAIEQRKLYSLEDQPQAKGPLLMMKKLSVTHMHNQIQAW